MRTLQIFVAFLLAAELACAQTAKQPDLKARFATLQSLAGEWVGTVIHDGKEWPASTSFRLVADGSAIMDDLAPGTPHEMITMFHMDGDDLLATHYCSHHNQVRLRAIPAKDPSILEFEFKDATNLATSTDPHMTWVRFTILDANHHIEEWKAAANGQAVTLRFDFDRKQ